jgi:hypothetical protein
MDTNSLSLTCHENNDDDDNTFLKKMKAKTE